MTAGGPELLLPDWPAPASVRAVSTTRHGGVSGRPWDSFNLGDHVGNDPAAVARNREILARACQLGTDDLHWLEQVHGAGVVELPGPKQARADASTATGAGEACVILTADCLPVLFCDESGTRVAAAHAGWRGLAAGVLEQTVSCFDEPSRVLAWLGPAIGPSAFEVGPEVRAAFVDPQPEAVACFQPHGPDRFLADLYGLARLRLSRAGVSRVSGGGRCTFSEPGQFYSYRRDGQTGRQASLVWLATQ